MALPPDKLGWRIHITGASGAGASTLSRALANLLASQDFDADDFLWQPTDPPFEKVRSVAERLQLMEAVFVPRSDWILSGSLHSWGAPIMERVTHVVFLSAPPALRRARLRDRERQRFGARVGKGGDLEASHLSFVDWAMRYDEPDNEGRSRAAHEAWLAGLDQPVLRTDGSQDVPILTAEVLAFLQNSR